MLNKSFLAPKADRVASKQLNFLTLNSPFTVIINNYKSNFIDLTVLRTLIIKNNGFSYHPNKNIKARAFEGFNMVLSPNVLSGLVVFAFFREYSNLKSFLDSFSALSDLNKLSYFSLLINGHLSNKLILSESAFSISKKLNLAKTTFAFNKNLFANSFNIVNFPLNKIYSILNAYIKSIN